MRLRHTSLTLDRFVSLTGLGPRSGLVAGLLIHDFALFDRVKRLEGGAAEERLGDPDSGAEVKASLPEGELSQSAGSRTVAEVQQAYSTSGLPRHPKKAIACETCADLWGGTVDGQHGLVWPALRRTIPLGFLVLQAASVGLATPELLEALSSSLVSVFQLRRRCLSILQRVYSEARGRAAREVWRMSQDLRAELLCAAVLLSQSDVDCRAPGAPLLIASDALSMPRPQLPRLCPKFPVGSLHDILSRKGYGLGCCLHFAP